MLKSREMDTPAKPRPILIGYFPKQTALRTDWLKSNIVEAICSASCCISKAPDGWIDQWKHNLAWWLYDSEEAAVSVAGASRARFDLYAYRVYPVMFDGAGATPIDVNATALGNLEGYQFLGYDMVSRSMGTGFECSPLSCNNGCGTYPVNKHCLMDDLDNAWRITQEIARDSEAHKRWEPGPYVLVEVYRKVTVSAHHVPHSPPCPPR